MCDSLLDVMVTSLSFILMLLLSPLLLLKRPDLFSTLAFFGATLLMNVSFCMCGSVHVIPAWNALTHDGMNMVTHGGVGLYYMNISAVHAYVNTTSIHVFNSDSGHPQLNIIDSGCSGHHLSGCKSQFTTYWRLDDPNLPNRYHHLRNLRMNTAGGVRKPIGVGDRSWT